MICEFQNLILGENDVKRICVKDNSSVSKDCMCLLFKNKDYSSINKSLINNCYRDNITKSADRNREVLHVCSNR